MMGYTLAVLTGISCKEGVHLRLNPLCLHRHRASLTILCVEDLVLYVLLFVIFEIQHEFLKIRPIYVAAIG